MNDEALKAAKEHDPSAPGKFAGEAPETVYYWHCMLDGDGEEHTFGVVFDISDAETQAFPSLMSSLNQFVIETTEQGFVYGSEITAAQYDKLVEDEEASEEESF